MLAGLLSRVVPLRRQMADAKEVPDGMSQVRRRDVERRMGACNVCSMLSALHKHLVRRKKAAVWLLLLPVLDPFRCLSMAAVAAIEVDHHVRHTPGGGLHDEQKIVPSAATSVAGRVVL